MAKSQEPEQQTFPINEQTSGIHFSSKKGFNLAMSSLHQAKDINELLVLERRTMTWKARKRPMV